MNPEPVIGIIGGMGPAAGAELFNKITRLTRAASDQEHLPVLLFSTPGQIADRTRFLLTGGPNPGDAIADVAFALESAGATVAGIPCNTAHAPTIMGRVVTRIRETGSRLQLIDMIEETVIHVRETVSTGARVGVLSTAGTRRSRIYLDPLSQAGYHTIELDEPTHNELVTGALYSDEHGIKVVAPPWTGARDRLIRAIERLTSDGAETVILGCTELPLAVPESHWKGLPLIDPAELLARALIRHSYPDRLRPDQS
jgi:aspartate racemase